MRRSGPQREVCTGSATRCTRRSAARDGDDIDYDAYRALVRYCVGDLGHSMLWLTSGIAEWWSLTIDERKQLVEVAIEEARAITPDTVIQACTSATSAKDCVELTQHAEAAGADICYLQTPPMEVHGGEGVLRFFQYVADRTDIALGMFNSPSSGYVLTPEDSARIANEIPAVCATKEGTMEHWRSKATHALAPELVIWECDTIVYRAGWLQQGIVGPAQLGTAGYLHETPDKPILTEYWNLVWEGRIAEAIEHAREPPASTGSSRESRDWYCTGTRVGPTTSRTGVRRSGAPRQRSGCRWATTRTPGRRRASCPTPAKQQIREPVRERRVRQAARARVTVDTEVATESRETWGHSRRDGVGRRPAPVVGS